MLFPFSFFSLSLFSCSFFLVVTVTVEPSSFTIVESAENRTLIFLVHKDGTSVRDISVAVTTTSNATSSTQVYSNTACKYHLSLSAELFMMFISLIYIQCACVDAATVYSDCVFLWMSNSIHCSSIFCLMRHVKNSCTIQSHVCTGAQN